MPPVPVITLTASCVPDQEAVCTVAECQGAAVVTWQVARSGVIFGDRWIAGEDVDLCREHDERALRLTGAEDYVDA